jgi:hypothetical protein
MKLENLSKSYFRILNSSELKLSVTVIFVFMVISSPVFMLASPTQVSAATTTTSNSNSFDTSNFHSDPQAMQAIERSTSSTTPPMASSHGNDFTAQAALIGPATFRSNDLVSSTAIYEIQFFTTTTAVIDKIDITFPAGTGVAFASILERTGITGPATVTKSGTTVTLDLNTPVNVPAGTLVRFEMVDISNPPNPANYKISVQTRNPSNVVIDGPSLSPAYTIRQVSSSMIANGAVSSAKIADGAVSPTDVSKSFVKIVEVNDTPGGNAVGWNPDGVDTFFVITDPDIISEPFGPWSSYVDAVTTGDTPTCKASAVIDGAFHFTCETPPPDFRTLHYMVITGPASLIQ